MGILSRLGLGAADRANVEAARVLATAYRDALQRARFLARHAELAPQEYSAAALRLLAERGREQAESLRRASPDLRWPPAPTDEVVEPMAGNHWGRLVQDLDRHREAARSLAESALRVADGAHEAAESLRAMARGCDSQIVELRSLVARADPQASG